MADDIYLEAMKLWAARRLTFTPSIIESVTFENVEGYSYSEYTEGPGYFCARVKCYGESWAYEIQEDPTTIVRECMEALHELDPTRGHRPS